MAYNIVYLSLHNVLCVHTYIIIICVMESMQSIRHSCAILSNNTKKFVWPAFSLNATIKRIQCIDKDKNELKIYSMNCCGTNNI